MQGEQEVQMGGSNYQSRWWGYIYDQMMEQDLGDLLESHRRFYRTNLQGIHGPVLECACGTGLFLLPLLTSGHELLGFDISSEMLAVLRSKAIVQGIGDIDDRISLQSLETFRYDHQFAAIIIPTNSFSMLTTQEAQIRALKNIYAHLAPGGKLLLDLNLAGMRGLVESPEIVEGRWHTWTHPETGRPIRQRIEGRYDFNKQLILDRCFIEYDGQKEDFPMAGRWIFKDEFQLLLRLGGFERWQAYGGTDREPLEIGVEAAQSYWIGYKT